VTRSSAQFKEPSRRLGRRESRQERADLRLRDHVEGSRLRVGYDATHGIGDGIWNIVYYSTLLGKIDERTARITGIGPGA
jgi:hypothetical protein